MAASREVERKSNRVKIFWLKTATRNRFQQLDYIAADNPAAAVRIDTQIENQTALLLAHPLIGRAGRVAGTRELVISDSPFLLVYRIRGQRIEILRCYTVLNVGRELTSGCL